MAYALTETRTKNGTVTRRKLLKVFKTYDEAQAMAQLLREKKVAELRAKIAKDHNEDEKTLASKWFVRMMLNLTCLTTETEKEGATTFKMTRKYAGATATHAFKVENLG